MTPEEIAQNVADDTFSWELAAEEIKKLIAAEREECAKLADDYARRAFSAVHGSDEAGVAADHIAKAIRARGE
jgi:hypothetical protein